jgi:hypothetical protein
VVTVSGGSGVINCIGGLALLSVLLAVDVVVSALVDGSGSAGAGLEINMDIVNQKYRKYREYREYVFFFIEM